MKANRLNVFERYTDRELLIGGLIITLAGSILGYLLKGRYDGFLDLHFVEQIAWWQPFADNMINVAVGTLLLFLLGKLLVNPKTRILDMLNAVLISRIFIYLLTLFNIGNFISNATERMMSHFPDVKYDLDLFLITVFGLFTLFVLVVFVFVLYLGFKVASNSKKQIHILYFLLAVIAAEAVTKFIFFILN